MLIWSFIFRHFQALERYIENLEKNQRCERVRLLRRQRELQENCAALASTVKGLQTDLQEKQRMIEAQGQRAHGKFIVRTGPDTASVMASQPPPPPHLPKMVPQFD